MKKLIVICILSICFLSSCTPAVYETGRYYHYQLLVRPAPFRYEPGPFYRPIPYYSPITQYRPSYLRPTQPRRGKH